MPPPKAITPEKTALSFDGALYLSWTPLSLFSFLTNTCMSNLCVSSQLNPIESWPHESAAMSERGKRRRSLSLYAFSVSVFFFTPSTSLHTFSHTQTNILSGETHTPSFPLTLTKSHPWTATHVPFPPFCQMMPIYPQIYNIFTSLQTYSHK